MWGEAEHRGACDESRRRTDGLGVGRGDRRSRVVRPIRRENLVGLAAEQEVEFLLEDAVDLFAERLIEIGHRPAAELEALGRILGRRAGRLHDAIHGNLSADDNLPHGSLSLICF
jgi:hypothetical protein